MSNKKSKSVVKDGLYNLAANYFAQACNIVRGFYSANILGPAGYGFWSVIQFYLEFAKYASFGMDEASARQITQNIEKGSYAENRYIIKFYSLFVLALGALIAVFGWFYIKYFVSSDRFAMYTTIFVFSALILKQLDIFLYALLNAYGRFKNSAIIRGAQALISVVTIVFLIKKYNVTAMYIAYILAIFVPLFVCFVLYMRSIVKEFYSILQIKAPYKKYALTLFKSSSSLLVVSLLSVTLVNLERFFITRHYSNYDNGIYFFASNIAMSLNLFVYSFTTVIYQRMNLQYGRSENKAEIFEYIAKACKRAAIFFPYVIMGGFYFVPLMFVLFFQKYVPSTYYLRCLVVSGYFYSVFMLLNYELIAIKKQKYLLVMYIALIALGAGLYEYMSSRYELKYIPIAVLGLNFSFMVVNIVLSKTLSLVAYKKRKLFAELFFFPALALFLIFIAEKTILLSNVYTDYIFRFLFAVVFYTVVSKLVNRRWKIIE